MKDKLKSAIYVVSSSLFTIYVVGCFAFRFFGSVAYAHDRGVAAWWNSDEPSVVKSMCWPVIAVISIQDRISGRSVEMTPQQYSAKCVDCLTRKHDIETTVEYEIAKRVGGNKKDLPRLYASMNTVMQENLPLLKTNFESFSRIKPPETFVPFHTLLVESLSAEIKGWQESVTCIKMHDYAKLELLESQLESQSDRSEASMKALKDVPDLSVLEK